MSTGVQHRSGPTTSGPRRSRRETVASLAMLAVFVVWTVGFIVISGLVASGHGGEVPYIKAWLPWIGVTALWVLPLITGLALGVDAMRRGGGRLATLGAGLNALLLLILIVPSLIDRLGS